VFPLASDEWGQIVAAAVVPEPGSAIHEEALIAFCRQHLAGFKVPRRFVVVDELPRNAGGKLVRAALRSLYTR
jgi:feruloyl-CoA synthase